MNNFAYKNNPNEITQMCSSQLQEYFLLKRKIFDIPTKKSGTEFQKRVWAALETIKYGKTCSYKDIAILIGNVNTTRAVGNANNKNPISIIIPCHRVVRHSGEMGGYAGGWQRKEKLLMLERALP